MKRIGLFFLLLAFVAAPAEAVTLEFEYGTTPQGRCRVDVYANSESADPVAAMTAAFHAAGDPGCRFYQIYQFGGGLKTPLADVVDLSVDMAEDTHFAFASTDVIAQITPADEDPATPAVEDPSGGHPLLEGFPQRLSVACVCIHQSLRPNQVNRERVAAEQGELVVRQGADHCRRSLVL